MLATCTRRVGLAALAMLAAASLSLTGCTKDLATGGSDEVRTIDESLATTIDEAMATAMQLSGSDAAIVGVWGESGEYVHAYGEGVQASAPIRAAQASQAVMCALLLDFVAQGNVTLDREVAKDLPRQPGIAGITYGQLCTATSGLADFKGGLADHFANNPTRPWSDRELLAQSLARSPLAEPGTAQHLSDTGALLLARALEQLSTTSLDELLAERVFRPGGMHSSSYPSDPLHQVTLPNGGMTGLSYTFQGGAPVCTIAGEEEGSTVPAEAAAVPQVSPSMLSGAGATITTITDLKRFYEHYLSGGFGENSAELITTLSAPIPEPAEGEDAPESEEAEPPAVDGWTFGLEKQGSLFGQSGAITGTMTAAYHDPAGKFTVVVTLNNAGAGAAFAKALAFQLAAIAGANVEWSAEDQAALLQERAICQPPAAEEAAAE